MKTLQDQWRAYREAVYPGGCSETQDKECHQAFMAGALVVLNKMLAIGEGGTEEAGMATINALVEESIDYGKSLVTDDMRKN